jgi:hypothetical protein
VQAGVWWINRNWNDYSDVGNEEEDYSDNVYFTRLHLRYNRKNFPQDLMFQVTPNTENYQARYIITHPATGDFSCDAGKKYLKDLKQRRADELEMLAYLTGKGYNDWDDLSMNNEEEKSIPAEASYAVAAEKSGSTRQSDRPVFYVAMGLIGILTIGGIARSRKVT